MISDFRQRHLLIKIAFIFKLTPSMLTVPRLANTFEMKFVILFIILQLFL